MLVISPRPSITVSSTVVTLDACHAGGHLHGSLGADQYGVGAAERSGEADDRGEGSGLVVGGGCAGRDADGYSEHEAQDLFNALIEDRYIGDGGEKCALLWFVYHLHHSVVSYPRL